MPRRADEFIRLAPDSDTGRMAAGYRLWLAIHIHRFKAADIVHLNRAAGRVIPQKPRMPAGGHTWLLRDDPASGPIQVNDIRGFETVYVNGKPEPVSSSHPARIRIGGQSYELIG